MEFAIRKNDDGHFQKESFLHNIIYPMRATSVDTPYSNHNLWLIDEKLAYCSYISSDIPFNNNPKEDRTDIMILDSPVAVSDEENAGREYESIVLFELKRPMRDDYSDSSNPVNQLYKAEHLRKVFNIDLSTYKWLFDKSFRNAGEHADERHALFSGCAGDYNVISKNTPENMRKEILTAPHIRTLDIRNWTYVTYDSKGRQISCDLQQLRAEAYMLLYQISTHSLLCNTKLTHIPTEKLLK